MARAITAGELTKLRADGQFSRLYLAILKPSTIYTAVLSAVPSSNDNVYEVAYNTGSGTLADVKAGMTMYVGTSAGAYDLGMCRVRSAPDASKIYIGLTSEIAWDTAGTIYLTIVDEFGLWVKPARNTSLDYNLAYSNQNSSFDPVPMLGSHEVLWLTGATVSAHFSASDSWVIGSTVSSYSWSAPGASATANLTSATPTITYNAAGRYRVYCTVTAANGKSFMGVRYVWVFSAASMPVTAFQLKSNPRCDYDQGGWSFDVTLWDEAELANIRERTMVILFARDNFQGTEECLGPITNRENIVCMGYVSGESIVWDNEAGSVDFQVLGPAGVLKQLANYPFQLKYKSGTASAWGQMPSLDTRRALFQLLHWRSSVTQVMDVTLDDDARAAHEMTAAKGSLWGQVEEIGRRIFARPGCDRYGRLFVEIDPQVTVEADRTWATVMTLTEVDWQERVILRRQTIPLVAKLNLTGNLTNTSGKMTPIYSMAMGHVPVRFGGGEQLDKILVSDQEQANELCGYVMGWRLNEWPDVQLTLAQNNRFVDCFPRQFLALTMDAADNERGAAFDGNLIARSVELVWDEEAGAFGTALQCEGETFAELAMTGDAPADSSVPPSGGGGSVPPVPPPITPGEVPPDGPRNAIIATGSYGLLYTTNLHEASPTWNFMNSGLPTDAINHCLRIRRAPSGLLVGLFSDVNASPDYDGWYLYYASGLGGSWQMLADLSTIDQGTTGVPRIVAFGVDDASSESIIMLAGGFNGTNVGAKKIYMGSRSGLSLVTGNLDVTNGHFDLTVFDGKWLLTGNEAATFKNEGWARFTSAGAVDSAWARFATSTGLNSYKTHHRGGGKAFMVSGTSNNSLRVISNNDGSVEVIYSPGFSFGNPSYGLAVSPDGTHLMGGNASQIGQRSSDGGATWGNIGTGGTGGMTVGYDAWANGGNNDWWFGATAQKILRTGDFGDTWEDRTGNLATLAPLSDITQMLIFG